MNERRLNIKNNKGITLIALIITIIVLLILAIVSIRILVNEGVIGKAKEATSRYTVAEEKEKIQLGYSEYKMAKINGENVSLTVEGALSVKENEEAGWTITFSHKEGNHVYTLTKDGTIELVERVVGEAGLRKYLLGKDEEGIDLSLVMDPRTGEFTDSNIQMIAAAEDGMDENGRYINYYYIKHENKAYRLVVAYEYNEGNNTASVTTRSLELVYTPDTERKEGTQITYSYDGTDKNQKEWTILYNNGDNYEIVSPDAMGNLELGLNDTEAQTPGDIDKDGTANTDVDKAIYSYNNAVGRINKYASSFVTNDNKISVRSVGSNQDKDEPGMYESEKLANLENGRYNGIGKNGDMYYEQDFVRMAYWGVISTTSDYWIASRLICDYTSKEVGFFMRSTYRGSISCGDLWGLNAEGKVYIFNNGRSEAVRPVVKISKDSIK